jgi:hypothetical protein
MLLSSVVLLLSTDFHLIVYYMFICYLVLKFEIHVVTRLLLIQAWKGICDRCKEDYE